MDISKELDSLQKTHEMISGAKWASFEKVGDFVQGTYIARYEATSPAGQDQIVYVLKDGDQVINVGRSVKDARTGRVMETAKFGQVVRFVFSALIPSKKPGHNAIKAIDAFTRPDLVDQKWLDEQGLEGTVEATSTDMKEPLAETLSESSDEEETIGIADEDLPFPTADKKSPEA